MKYSVIKPYWMGLITAWVTIWEISHGVLLGKSGWHRVSVNLLQGFVKVLLFFPHQT